MITTTSFVFFCFVVHCQVPLAQRNALISLYDATDGSNWNNNNGWNTASDPCTWFGVGCDIMLNNVISIFLESNNLVGTLPNTVFPALNTLESLYLANNQITGTLPDSWSTFSNLETFVLHNNRLINGSVTVFFSSQ